MLGYPRRALNRTQTEWIDIKVDYMTMETALFWDQEIQSHIRARAGEERAAGQRPSRADVYWRWPGMRVLFPLAQTTVGRSCRALSVFVRSATGKAIPAGMLLLIERYPWLLTTKDGAGDSVFTWFLTSAPTERLRELGVADPPSLGQILVDIALVTSLALDSKGRMWLHASPAGGPRLLDFYGKMCGLERYPAGAALPGRRQSDGRHFFATPYLAEELVSKLEATR